MTQEKNELSEYRIFGLSLLQLMLILGVVGIVATIVLRMFF
jgi:hypothetical protein